MPSLDAFPAPRKTPLAVVSYTATTGAGAGIGPLRDALYEGASALVRYDPSVLASDVALATWIGAVPGLDRVVLPTSLADRDCRIHRLASLALAQDGFGDAVADAVGRHGAARVGLFVGTSTSTIAESEGAYREHAATGVVPARLANRGLHHLHAATAFVRDALSLGGPTVTISTACSSSAKVFAQATRMIACGIVDAAVVGGIDSLAASTLFGFASLGLVSARPCRPFDRARDGISIGEGAAFVLVERFDAARHGDLPLVVGYGESSDAFHMAAPHPEGVGARRAIDDALRMAGLAPSAVDHVNLHGTATSKNDAVEAGVVANLFAPSVRASSTKGVTGHTLGAAGAIEAVACLVAMSSHFTPGTVGCDDPDDDCEPRVRRTRIDGDVGIALSNAFAFGGNNAVLAFARDMETWRTRTST